MPKAGRGGGGDSDIIFLTRDSGVVKPATEANVGDRIVIENVEYVLELKRPFSDAMKAEFPHLSHSLGLSRPKGKTAYSANLFTSGLVSSVVSLGSFAGRSDNPVQRKE